MKFLVANQMVGRYIGVVARVVKLVNAADSKSAAERLVGSIPTSGTILLLTSLSNPDN